MDFIEISQVPIEKNATRSENDFIGIIDCVNGNMLHLIMNNEFREWNRSIGSPI